MSVAHLPSLEGRLRGRDQRLTLGPYDGTTPGLDLRVEIQLGKDVPDDAHMILGLIEVPLPVGAKVLVHGASDRGLIDLDPTEFRLEGLIQKLLNLCVGNGPRLLGRLLARITRKTAGSNESVRS